MQGTGITKDTLLRQTQLAKMQLCRQRVLVLVSIARSARPRALLINQSRIMTVLYAKCKRLATEAYGTPRVVAVVLRRCHHYAADGRHSFIHASVVA